MDKKLLIIIAVAVVLIAVGAVMIVTNPFTKDVSQESLDVPLKTQNLGLFEIDLPKGSNFTVKNEAEGMKYYTNNGKFSGNFSGIIINKNLTDTLVGDNVVPISNTTNEKIYAFDLKNKTNYKLVSVHDDVDIILLGDDLNLLKEISDTIKIKDVSNL